MAAMEGVWSAIINVSTIVTVLSFLIWLYSAWALWQKRRQYKQRLALLPQQLGQGRPAALVVGLGRGGASVRGTVEQYLRQHRPDIQVIEEVSRDRMIDEREFGVILDELLEVKSRLTESGITELHLFNRGPVTLAAAIGAMVDNWVPTTAYNYRDGTYHPELVISKQTILGT